MSPGEGLPILITSRQGSGQGCPLLRASNEHIPIVRVLRASRAPGRSLPILLRKEDDGERLLVKPRGILLPYFPGIARPPPL